MLHRQHMKLLTSLPVIRITLNTSQQTTSKIIIIYRKSRIAIIQAAAIDVRRLEFLFLWLQDLLWERCVDAISTLDGARV